MENRIIFRVIRMIKKHLIDHILNLLLSGVDPSPSEAVHETLQNKNITFKNTKRPYKNLFGRILKTMGSVCFVS